jgi:hypothetical protein
MAVASPSLYPPLPPSLNGTPHCRIGCEWLHPAPSNVDESAVDQFWEQFGDGSEPGSRAFVLPVPGLTKHELPARRVIS